MFSLDSVSPGPGLGLLFMTQTVLSMWALDSIFSLSILAGYTLNFVKTDFTNLVDHYNVEKMKGRTQKITIMITSGFLESWTIRWIL